MRLRARFARGRSYNNKGHKKELYEKDCLFIYDGMMAVALLGEAAMMSSCSNDDDGVEDSPFAGTWVVTERLLGETVQENVDFEMIWVFGNKNVYTISNGQSSDKYQYSYNDREIRIYKEQGEIVTYGYELSADGSRLLLGPANSNKNTDVGRFSAVLRKVEPK